MGSPMKLLFMSKSIPYSAIFEYLIIYLIIVLQYSLVHVHAAVPLYSSLVTWLSFEADFISIFLGKILKKTQGSIKFLWYFVFFFGLGTRLASSWRLLGAS